MLGMWSNESFQANYDSSNILERGFNCWETRNVSFKCRVSPRDYCLCDSFNDWEADVLQCVPSPSAPSPLSPLESYNSLQDHHLMGYYSNPKKLRHLRKMGLVSDWWVGCGCGAGSRRGDLRNTPCLRCFQMPCATHHMLTFCNRT